MYNVSVNATPWENAAKKKAKGCLSFELVHFLENILKKSLFIEVKDDMAGWYCDKFEVFCFEEKEF